MSSNYISLTIKSIRFVPSQDGLIDPLKNQSISDISSYTHKLSKPKLFDNSQLECLQNFADDDSKCLAREFNPVIYIWCRDSLSSGIKVNVHDLTKKRHSIKLTFPSDFIPSNHRNPVLFYLVTKYTEEYMGVTGISGQCWLDWDTIFNSVGSRKDISINVYKVLTDDQTKIRGKIILSGISYSGNIDHDLEPVNIDDRLIIQDGWATETSIYQRGGLSPYDDNHKVTHSIIYITGGRLITAAPYYIHIHPKKIDQRLLVDLLKLGCTMMSLPFDRVDISVPMKKRLYAVAFAQGLSLLAKLCYYRTDIARYINNEHVGCTTDDDLWSDVGLTGSGDCEDMAKFSFSIVCAVMDCQNDLQSGLLNAAKDVLKMYIPFMMHGGVTVGSASQLNDSSPNEGYTSHMFAILIPRKRFLQSLYYGSKNGVEQESNRKLRDHSNVVNIDKIKDRFQVDSDQMPVLILEGTGYLDPTVIPIGLACKLDSSYTKRYQNLYIKENNNNTGLLGGLGFQCSPNMDLKTLLQRGRCSNFYKSVVSGMTHRRFTRSFVRDGYELTSFVFHDIGRTYGIPMTQFLLYYSYVTDDIPQLIQPVTSHDDDSRDSRCLNPTSHLFCVPSSIRTRETFHEILDMVRSWVIPPSSMTSLQNSYKKIEKVFDIDVITDLDHILQNVLDNKQNILVARYNPTLISNIEHSMKFLKIYIYPLSKFDISNIETSVMIFIY